MFQACPGQVALAGARKLLEHPTDFALDHFQSGPEDVRTSKREVANAKSGGGPSLLYFSGVKLLSRLEITTGRKGSKSIREKGVGNYV